MIGTSAGTFGSLVTAMVTPFGDDGKIDYKAVEHLVEHLIQNKTDSIVVSGTTGESPTLSDDEKTELLKAVLQIAKKRVKIIMGTGSNDTHKSVAASQNAQSLGADGVLLVAPYYNKPNQAGLKAHFGAIAKSVDLPCILYNIPGRTGITIATETIVQLDAEHKNIVALKDSTGNVEQAQEVGRLASDKFRIYSGDDNLTLPFLSVGACGVVSVASHVIGSEIKAMIDAFFAGKTDDARLLHYKYLPIFKGLFIAPNPTCVKYMLGRLGIGKDHLRLPLVPLSVSEREQMDALMKDLKLAATAGRN